MNALAPLIGLASLAVPASRLIFAPDIPERLRKLPATRIDYDHSLLDPRETAALKELIEAARPIREIFLRQVSTGNPDLSRRLEAEAHEPVPGSADALALFRIQAGPWDRLDRNAPFIGKDPKPPGAAFYPADMTKEEFTSWVASHPSDRDAFNGLFTVIRRGTSGLTAVPYSREYRSFLDAIVPRLRKAAETTGNASLRTYLAALSKSLLADDYYYSDLAWMDLDSEIEFILGPYEVYEDQLFNFKAAFTAFVTVRDKAESAKLAVYAKHLPDMERNLPIPDEHKNFDRKFESPIRVVQEVFTAGDTRAGVQTAAFNLPNDERVRRAKGSKKVLLKNVIEAKYRVAGKPIAERVLDPSQLPSLSFDAFFNHTLFHELAHGLGPGFVKGPDGKKVEVRILLKDRYSTIEECKADVVGMWILLQAIDNKWLTSFDETALAVTVSALFYRSIRFGVDEAHGGGTAVQWNWFRENGAVAPAGNGRFRVDVAKFREAVRSLSRELLLIEATGDLPRAERLLSRYAVSNPEMESVNARLQDIPVDIAPVFVAAGETLETRK